MSLFTRTGKRFLPERFKRGIKLACGVPDTDSCLVHLKGCGFSPNVAIDVGAYSGEWTRALLRVFPGTRVLMIEPQAIMLRELEVLASSYRGLEVANVLVGPRVADRVGFYESETASSVLQDANHDRPPSMSLPMTTLDILIRETKFASPDFIKLDIQGYELEALKGGQQTLESAEVVQMEVNLIPIYRDAPLAHDAIGFMAERGFRVYDVGTFFRRPYDRALWQMDMFFVRASSPLMASSRWS